MPIGLIGRKLGMSQMYDEAGVLAPVTVIQAGPCPILTVKSPDSDGYTAVQLGYEPKAESRASKPELGQARKNGVPVVRMKREFRVDDLDGLKVGAQLDVTVFAVGDTVDVIGRSIGRGFAGPVKRHHTRGGPDTHGSMYHRRPGSMGASSFPSRTFPGKKLAGHMGAARVTVKHLTVLAVDKDKNLLVVRGSTPGPKNGVVMVRKSVAPKSKEKK